MIASHSLHSPLANILSSLTSLPKLVAQMVKSLLTMLKTWVQSPGWEDPLEKEMATHSSVLTWEIPGIEEPGGLQSLGLQRITHN